MLALYRRSGADLPWGDPRRYHGVAFEGWFWRITRKDPPAVVIALLGVNRAPDGSAWGTVGLAAHPGGFSRSAAVQPAAATPDGLRVVAGTAAEATPEGVRFELGPGARLQARFDEPVAWPRRGLGGIGLAQVVPSLSQYWHPFMLGSRVRGVATIDGEEIDLDGATAYGEKNWGAGGFPPVWWWGQSHGFERDDVCVAFAGGRAGVGPLQTTATAVVARVGDTVVRVVRPLRPLSVDVDEGRWRLAGGGIELEGHANGTAPHMLPVPIPSEMRNLPDAATQHLAGELRLRVRRRGRTLFDGVSLLAGLERGNGRPAPRPAAPPA